MDREVYFSKDESKIILISSFSQMNEDLRMLDRMKYRYEHMLVIGNGFDLNLGLPTRYSDFIQSSIFKRMYVKRIQKRKKQGNPQPSLLDYLYGKKFYERWYDIEAAMLDYISSKKDGNFVNNIKDDKIDYQLVCDCLGRYLVSIFKSGNDLKQAQMMENSYAGQLLKRLNSQSNIIYSFNYTPLKLIVNAVLGNNSLETIRLHGKIKEENIFKGNTESNNIILGVETTNINEIAPGYTFMLKSNSPIYKSTRISLDLLNSRHVILFGHSLNSMDFGYFREFFQVLEKNVNESRRLTIITKDNNSRIDLLDNLRRNGISVRDVFAHARIDIVLTDEIDNKNLESHSLFKQLLEDVSHY